MPSSPNPHRKSTAPTLAERFWAKVDKHGPVCASELGPCWMWTAATTVTGGYGSISVGGKQVRAHRVSFQLSVGPIPPGQWVLHRCDNPPCIRPEHLFLGTDRDNQRDRAAKGRHLAPLERMLRDLLVAPWHVLSRAAGPAHPFGESHCRAKLTTSQVSEIRRRYIPRRVSTRKLAAEFGVSPRAIRAALSGETWKHG